MNSRWTGIWHRAERRAGRSGIAGLALAGAALLVAASLPHFQQQGQLLRAQLAAQRIAPVAARAATPQLRAADAFDAFPPLSQSPRDLQALFASARQHQVGLLRAQYQLRQDARAPLLIYTVTLPLRCDYASLKQFAADVLAASPHASLDELRMQRSSAASNLLDAVVRFSFVYRGS